DQVTGNDLFQHRQQISSGKNNKDQIKGTQHQPEKFSQISFRIFVQIRKTNQKDHIQTYKRKSQQNPKDSILPQKSFPSHCTQQKRRCHGQQQLPVQLPVGNSVII